MDILCNESWLITCIPDKTESIDSKTDKWVSYVPCFGYKDYMYNC